jgi:hypothetical protein
VADSKPYGTLGGDQGLFFIDRHPPSGANREQTNSGEYRRCDHPAGVHNRSVVGEEVDRCNDGSEAEVHHPGPTPATVIREKVCANKPCRVEVVGQLVDLIVSRHCFSLRIS